MSIFKSIKEFITSSNSNVDETVSRMGENKPNSSDFISEVRLTRFNHYLGGELNFTSQDSWDEFFKYEKQNPTLIGFEKRSRRQFRNLYHSDNIIVAEAAGTIEITSTKEVLQIPLKDTKLEKMRATTANEKAIILHKQESVAMIDHETKQFHIFEFEWQPFNFAMGNDFWLVGTRETYDGPGELYCFDYSGKLNWAMSFKEQIVNVFGEFLFTPYLLEVSIDSTDIFVSSMDRLYRLDVHGNLKTRISIGELQEREMQNKYNQLQQSLSSPRTEEEAISAYATELANQFMMGFKRMTFASPFAGFAHDPATDMVFILEEKGRVSAWNKDGDLVWINTFKNSSRYIRWLDDKLIVSFNTGETFWLNKKGKFIYGANLPKKASTISLIPNQEKYIVICEDNRLYELEKGTGNLITGSEGHPGMELFTFSGRNVFFDGGISTKGYYWLAPDNHVWKQFESKNILESKMDVTTEVPVEISETKRFRQMWEVTSEEDWFGSREIDIQSKRIYVVEKGPRKSGNELRNLSDKELMKDTMSHYLTCYDFEGDVIWRNHVFSSMSSLYLSPDGKFIFTSAPSESDITYLPGYILIYSEEGRMVNKIKVEHHGYHLNFTSHYNAVVNFSVDRGSERKKGILNLIDNKRWGLTIDEENGQTVSSAPFGAGLNNVATNSYYITRKGKKKYVIKSVEVEKEFTFSEAINEAHQISSGQLILRVGNRAIKIFDQNLRENVELKEKENVLSITSASSTIAVLTKTELKGYDLNGNLKWKYSSIPKASENSVTWISKKQVYLWSLSNSHIKMVASINEKGDVINSQAFDSKEYYRSIIVNENDNSFIAQTNGIIQAYCI
ncbi:ornithine cyclodeaminase [Bacillus spongiae]|uniref:Ornithine cyclodeaminase n=1 Tax=Bacillus spongiae TaxID=2683610 RepID=A0ABU8HBG0_9BACI